MGKRETKLHLDLRQNSLDPIWSVDSESRTSTGRARRQDHHRLDSINLAIGLSFGAVRFDARSAELDSFRKRQCAAIGLQASFVVAAWATHTSDL